ncbi:MAG TPA: class E sortase, partial [Acidimicrobiales bacterium]|nr:class E sortase [Acidimicrobiales bacterium]
IGEIRIPAIGLDQVVVEGTATADLRKGPGHYLGTPLPGQGGNAAIAGHRTTYGHPFYSLDALQVGDPIVLTTLQGVFVYDVTGSRVVSPSDTAVLDHASADLLTLTTCNPRYSAATRLVVQAALVHSRLFLRAPALPKEGSPGAATSPVPHTTLAGDSSVAVAATVGWGAALVALGVVVFFGVWLFRPRRWLVYGAGIAAALILLWFFFGALTPLLPASF